MATQQGLARQRLRYRCSSSILNWKDKIEKRFELKEGWGLGHTIFFGCYHIGDYLRILLHRGKRTIFWCGSDLRDLSWWKSLIIKHIKARHVVETNQGEWVRLHNLGIDAEVLPQFFGDPNEFQLCFKPSDTPHVFMNCHQGRGKEYGLDIIELIAGQVPEITFHVYGVRKPFHEIWEERLMGFPTTYPTGKFHNVEYATRSNIKYHGKVSEEQFNEEIKNYHAGLRLNKFDGNSDVVMKSVLLGQYPITYLQYPHIDCCETTETTKPLIRLLKELKQKKVANPASEYWRQRLSVNKNILLQEEQNQI